MILLLIAHSFAETPTEAPAPVPTPDVEPVQTAEAPVVAPAPPPPAPPARLTELSLRWVAEGDSWVVRDGGGHVVDARTWAILTGDPATLARIDAARTKGRRLGWGLLAGGGLLATSSLVPAFLLEDALSANESTTEFNALGARNDGKVAAAFALLGSGLIVAGTGVVAHAAADRRALELPRILTVEEADAGIAAYNKHVQEMLTPVAAQ